MQLKRRVDRDHKKTLNRMARSDVYINSIIKDQERILEVSRGRIKGINKDLRALRFRLRPYTTGTVHDDKYFELKDKYAEALQERKTLQNTIQIIEESITGAQLNTLPGQEYQKGEQL